MPVVFWVNLNVNMQPQRSTKEALALVQAITWVKPVYGGLTFIVPSDLSTLRWLFRHKMPTAWFSERYRFPRKMIRSFCTKQGQNLAMMMFFWSKYPTSNYFTGKTVDWSSWYRHNVTDVQWGKQLKGYSGAWLTPCHLTPQEMRKFTLVKL